MTIAAQLTRISGTEIIAAACLKVAYRWESVDSEQVRAQCSFVATSFDEYQDRASKTETVANDPNVKDQLIIPLLGLAGESGTLLSEFKKKYRDGPDYRLFDSRIAEELGDILWYLATIARHCDLKLSEVAELNLKKVEERWDKKDDQLALPFKDDGFFDSRFSEGERLPRQAKYKLIEIDGKVRVFHESWPYPVGDWLRDNAWTEDGYRFHDVIHLTFATILRWSPITRRLLNCKRRQSDTVDEIEDGGRAGVIEEAVVALLFDYAKAHSFLQNAKEVDFDIIRTIRRLTEPFEVRRCSTADWEQAIMDGFKAWSAIKAAHGGYLCCDAVQKTICFEPLFPEKQTHDIHQLSPT